MNTIDRSYRRRGKQVHLQELTDLVAVRSESTGTSMATPMVAGLAALIQSANLQQVRAFEDAGWAFVSRQQATNGVKVYLESNGRVALGTNQLTVRIAHKYSEDQAKDLLTRYGFSIVQRLKLASNLFVIAVPADLDVLDAAARLVDSGEVDFAEPDLIEVISAR